MIKRLLEAEIRKSLQIFPVVAIVGPRQAGKTTLARMVFEKLAKTRNPLLYLDLELPSDLTKLAEPEIFLESMQDRLVVIDEIQRRPDLFPLLRALIDKKRTPGRFLILGSANLSLIQNVSESLAGRVTYQELAPFVRPEVQKKIALKRHWFRGGYPDALLAQTDDICQKWLGSLLQSYFERDIPQLGFRISSYDLRRYMTMLAHNHGQLWNAQQLASSFGVSQPTINHYRGILDRMFLIRIIPPWHANIKKRLVKAPRVYIRESGLLHVLLNIGSVEDLVTHPINGKSWEGFVIEQIIGTIRGNAEISFFRSHAGAEIDLVLHRGAKVLAAVEIKYGLSPQVTRGFHEALRDLGNPPAWIIYSGKERYPIAEGVTAIGLDEFTTREVHLI